MTVESQASTAADRAGEADRAAAAAQRRDVYRFLSAALLEAPAAEFLHRLGEERFLAAVAQGFSRKIVEAFTQIREALASPEFPAKARQEFFNLFVVPGGQYVAPYESVFRDRREIEGREVTGLLMGKSAIDVQQWYRLAALEVDGDFRDLPDHVGLELHYLAYLCEKEREFVLAGDEAKARRAGEMQRDFLKSHLAVWLGALGERVRAKAALPLYPAVADLALEFCLGDLANLEARLGPGSGRPLPCYDG